MLIQNLFQSLLTLLALLYSADALLFSDNCSFRSLRLWFHFIYFVHASGVEKHFNRLDRMLTSGPCLGSWLQLGRENRGTSKQNSMQQNKHSNVSCFKQSIV